MKPVKLRPLPLLAWGGAWVCLSGLALVRLWALLYGRAPSLSIPALAAHTRARTAAAKNTPLPAAHKRRKGARPMAISPTVKRA